MVKSTILCLIKDKLGKEKSEEETKILTLYGNSSKIDFIRNNKSVVVKMPNNQLTLNEMEVSFLQNAIEGLTSFLKWLTEEYEAKERML